MFILNRHFILYLRTLDYPRLIIIELISQLYNFSPCKLRVEKQITKMFLLSCTLYTLMYVLFPSMNLGQSMRGFEIILFVTILLRFVFRFT